MITPSSQTHFHVARSSWYISLLNGASSFVQGVRPWSTFVSEIFTWKFYPFLLVLFSTEDYGLDGRHSLLSDGLACCFNRSSSHVKGWDIKRWAIENLLSYFFGFFITDLSFHIVTLQIEAIIITKLIGC